MLTQFIETAKDVPAVVISGHDHKKIQYYVRPRGIYLRSAFRSGYERFDDIHPALIDPQENGRIPSDREVSRQDRKLRESA